MSWPPPDPTRRTVGARGDRASQGRPREGRLHIPGRHRPRGPYAPPGPRHRPPTGDLRYAEPPRARGDLAADATLPPGRVWWGTGEHEIPVDEPFGPPPRPRPAAGPPPGRRYDAGPPPGSARRPPPPGRAPYARGPQPPPRPPVRPPVAPPDPRHIVQARRLAPPTAPAPGPPGPDRRPAPGPPGWDQRPAPGPRGWAPPPPPPPPRFAPPPPGVDQDRLDGHRLDGHRLDQDDWASEAGWSPDSNWVSDLAPDDGRDDGPNDDWLYDEEWSDDGPADGWDDDGWALPAPRADWQTRSGEVWFDEPGEDAWPAGADPWGSPDDGLDATRALGSLGLGSSTFDRLDADPAVDYDDPLRPLTYAGPNGRFSVHDVDLGAGGTGRRQGPRRRGRRLVWLAAAAVLAVAVAVPLATRTAPATEPLAIEVLPASVPGESHRVRLSGWVDELPGGEAPQVRIEVDGRKADEAPADGQARQRWEWHGPRDERGFGFTVDVGPGAHKVCVIAVDDGRTLQCVEVTVPDTGGSGGTGPAGGGTTPAAPGESSSTTALAIPPDAPSDTIATTTEIAPPAPTPDPTTAPPTVAPPPPTVARPPAPPVDNSWQAQMLNAVNAERAKVNADPLALCAPLSNAAQSYAQLMANTKTFSHTGPDGSTFDGRIKAAGYRGGSMGENIAQGYADVAAVMKGWMGSKGHRENILRPGYTHIGVGWVKAGNYWVQTFGAGGTC